MAEKNPDAGTLTGAITRTLRRHAQKVALIFENRRFTFGELDALSDKAAHGLRRLGVTRGDRVALYLPNGPEFVLAYLANLKIGAVPVPINAHYRETELRHVLRDSGARLLIGHASLESIVGRVLPTTPTLEQVILTGAASKRRQTTAFEDWLSHETLAPRADAEPQPDDLAGIYYTSGTTGRPKGAMLTQQNLLRNIRALVTAWELSADDRLLLCLPLFHVHGLHNGLHGALITGMTAVLMDRFRAEPVLELLAAENCTLFYGVPTMYHRLLAVADSEARARTTSMRLFVSGSAPLPERLFHRFRDVFGHTLMERYGMTETAMITSNPYRGERRPGSVGHPLPGVSLRVVDTEGNDCGMGETGEMWVRGESVFRGYWRQPEATGAAFAPGAWFRTGDLGRWDADGYYYLVGRKRELIISGGFNIYPREVEECLLQHPAVRDCAVVGAPDADRGELVHAYVVTSENNRATEAAIIAHCQARLAPFKAPRRVSFVSELPRTPSGKVMKHRLKDRQGA